MEGNHQMSSEAIQGIACRASGERDYVGHLGQIAILLSSKKTDSYKSCRHCPTAELESVHQRSLRWPLGQRTSQWRYLNGCPRALEMTDTIV